MRVVFTPEAERQADETDTWWRAHRSKASGLSARELTDVREPIANTPTLGVRHRTRSGKVADTCDVATAACEGSHLRRLRGAAAWHPGTARHDLRARQASLGEVLTAPPADAPRGSGVGTSAP